MGRIRLLSVIILFSLLAAAMMACQGSTEVVPTGAPNTAAPTPTMPPAWDPSKVVLIGTSGDFPPANFINESGEIDGFERELGDELCRRAGLECAWGRDEWFTLITNLVAGKYDAIVAGMAATEERDELIDFTESYLPNTPSVYVALAGASDDVINGRVAVQVNTIQQKYLADSGTTRIISLPAEAPVEALRSGEADAVFADKTFLASFVEESGGELIFVGPEVNFDSYRVGIGVREGDGDLKDKLNEAIGAMKGDGTLNDLIRKWFGEDAETS
jgi:polar amino acid transport system substrate-binding protein